MKLVMLAILLFVTIFSGPVSSWGIGAYTSPDCFNTTDSNYDFTILRGDDTTEYSDCIVFGDAVDPSFHCHHRNDVPCTGPMDPPPLGVYYTRDSDCCVGYSADCFYNTCDFHGDQCLWTEGMPGASSAYLTFKCRQQTQFPPMKIGFDDDGRPIDVPM